MGPPRSKKIAALQARSRFCEGSMNDRTSAAPPMHFLGPDAIDDALEPPVPLHRLPQDVVDPTARYSTSSTATQSSTQTTNRLSGSKLLGQVWDGLFRGKRWSRRGDADEQQQPSSAPAGHMTRSKTASTSTSTSTPASGNNFASREEVLANYNQLVAEGFFKAKAVHCTRQPGPPPSVPAPKPPAEVRHARRPSASDAAKEPETWPLPAAAAASASADTPAKATRSMSPIRSPASASSRGTKRAAADDDEEELDDSRRHHNHSSATADKENVAPAAAAAPVSKESQPKKRLRTIASRDGLFMPKLRSVASRRNMQGSSRRSISASEANSARETNKLSKRQPPQPGAHPSTTARGMFDMPLNYQPRNQHLRPTLRNVSDGGGGGGGEQRVLRSQRSLDGRLAPLTVVPDANRGIPGVPAIPPKFTYGEDRENGTPWRGLRIR